MFCCSDCFVAADVWQVAMSGLLAAGWLKPPDDTSVIQLAQAPAASSTAIAEVRSNFASSEAADSEHPAILVLNPLAAHLHG